MVSEALDFQYLLLDNYKKLKFNEKELAVLLMINHLISSGNPFVTADLLSIKMPLDTKTIDSILANLLTRGFIAYETNGKNTVTTLNPLKKILFKQFQLNSFKEEDEENNKRLNEQLPNIYARFEENLGRSLSPIEISRIREWAEFGYSDTLIINALKEALSRKRKSFNEIDRILLSWAARDDIETEGHSSINQDWNKNLEETIRIAKTPWLDTGDDKE